MRASALTPSRTNLHAELEYGELFMPTQSTEATTGAQFFDTNTTMFGLAITLLWKSKRSRSW
jgi:hypothetical protein